MAAARATLSLLLLGTCTHVGFGYDSCSLQEGVALPTSQADCDAFRPGSVYSAMMGHCIFVVQGSYTPDQCARTVCPEHSAGAANFFLGAGRSAPRAWTLPAADGAWLGHVKEITNRGDGHGECAEEAGDGGYGPYHASNGCQVPGMDDEFRMTDQVRCCNVCLYYSDRGETVADYCDQNRSCTCEYPTKFVEGSDYDRVMTAHLAGCDGSISLVARLGAAAAFASMARMLM